MNLFEETDHTLKEIGKTWDDVFYIYARESDWDENNNKTYGISIKDFVQFSKAFEYNDGFGSSEVNPTLRIVFTDFSWLERHEYDGAECWHYKKLEVPKEKCPYELKYFISQKSEDVEIRNYYRNNRK